MFYFANGIFVLLICVGKIKVGYVVIRIRNEFYWQKKRNTIILSRYWELYVV